MTAVRSNQYGYLRSEGVRGFRDNRDRSAAKLKGNLQPAGIVQREEVFRQPVKPAGTPPRQAGGLPATSRPPVKR